MSHHHSRRSALVDQATNPEQHGLCLLRLNVKLEHQCSYHREDGRRQATAIARVTIASSTGRGAGKARPSPRTAASRTVEIKMPENINSSACDTCHVSMTPAPATMTSLASLTIFIVMARSAGVSGIR